MEVVVYAIIFIIGTLFGSFFTLAVYRIPLGLNILTGNRLLSGTTPFVRFPDRLCMSGK